MSIWYVGSPDGSVSMADDNQDLGPLPHHGKYSSTFAWGHAGNGPADLARSLLVNALGPAARCQERADCEGCAFCEDGISVPADEVTAFKLTKLTKLTSGRSWAMTSDDIVDWHREWVRGRVAV